MLNTRPLIWLFLLLAPWSLAAENTQSRLNKTLEAFNLAFQQADTATLNRLLHSDYRHTNSGNLPIDKTAWLNWIATRTQRVEKKQLVYQGYETQDLDIQYYDGFAIVTGRNIATGSDRGKPFKVDIRFTHVWVVENGRWLRLSFHDAPAKG